MDVALVCVLHCVAVAAAGGSLSLQRVGTNIAFVAHVPVLLEK